MLRFVADLLLKLLKPEALMLLSLIWANPVGGPPINLRPSAFACVDRLKPVIH